MSNFRRLGSWSARCDGPAAGTFFDLCALTQMVACYRTGEEQRDPVDQSKRQVQYPLSSPVRSEPQGQKHMSLEKEDVTRRSDRPRGRPFPKGNGGRKAGSRNKSTLVAEALLRGEEVELVRKAIELAKGGDAQMLKFLLDRILPKDRPVKIDLPEVNSPRTAAKALTTIIQAVRAGEIAPAEGAAVANLVAGLHRFVDITYLEERIKALEAAIEELGAET